MSSLKLFRLLPVVVALVAPSAFGQAPIANESAAIAEAAQRFMASGQPLVIKADALKAQMADAANTPALISVCAPPDHARFHLPGSINLPRGAFWKAPMQAKLPPKDKAIVTYCYTGTGAVGPALVLNLMGWKAVQLEYGTMGWSKDDAGLGPASRFPASQENFPVVKGPQAAAATYERPVVSTGKATLAEVLVARGDAVEMADKTVSMTAKAVQELLTDASLANDPFVVDVRAPADFVKAHIGGAINIPMATVFQPGELVKLPPGRRIVVADYNGQTAVGVSYLLSILGYNARGLQFGMMGWSTDDALVGPYKRFPADQRDFASNRLP